MRRVYLAGFDVFLPDAVAHGERLKALAAAHGFEDSTRWTTRRRPACPAPRWRNGSTRPTWR